MVKNVFLDEKWQEFHLAKVKKRAGKRYSPELNIELPIAEIFEGISRTESFYYKIRRYYGKLNREFSRVSKKYKSKDVQKLYIKLKNKICQLTKLLDQIKDYNTEKINWKQINKLSKKANEILRILVDKLRKEKYEIENQGNKNIDNNQRSISERHSTDIHYLYEVQKELRYFDDFSMSANAKLSNSPFLFLNGVAGTGKTHLLCDILKERIKGIKKLPTVLVFGELFETSEDPFTQIIHQIGLKINTTQFLCLLNCAGEKMGCRSIITIDALNETRNRYYWSRNLKKVIEEVIKYPNVALVVSVRTGFEGEVIPKKLKKIFIHEEHRGFEFREWEAVKKFFREFQLLLPEIPLLMPEFRNPLFLLLFCKAFENRSIKIIYNKQRQVFRGHEGATYIFESFVDNVSMKIARQFKISNKAGKNIWDVIIEKIAAEMVEKNDDRISENQLVTLIKKAYPTIDYGEFIKEFERNLLLVKIPRYSREKNGYCGYDFRFPFQKFSDHLIGRYLFKKYEQEFGQDNKNMQTAKKYFSKRRKLGKFLANSWNRGIIEALSIQCPEFLKGCELVEVMPYIKDSNIAQEAFIESIIWRKPNSFTKDIKNTLAYINSKIMRTQSGCDNLFNAFLTVAPVPNHPFNADCLHKNLFRFSMPERDSWWSIFLHYHYGNKGAIDRLVEWGWSAQDKTHINEKSIRLCSVALCWFLTTSNRFLRDKASKSLVNLLTNRLPVVLKLLKQFKDVNDPYIAERLYAVAYGCAIRSRNDKEEIKILSEWVYNEIFKDGKPPTHILLRDYARGVIEVALYEKIEIKIDRKKIEPPYCSDCPKRVPSENFLRKKYYPKDFFDKKTENRGFLDIWSSVMSDYSTLGDFGRYILNHAVGHWSRRRLNSKQINRKYLFEDFKNKLTMRQKELLGKATNTFFGVDFSKIITSIRFNSSDRNNKTDEEKLKKEEKNQKKETEKAYEDFENSISEKKKKFFEKEIKPYLNERGSISDPLENFNTSLAQRWVFNRVVRLGWNQKLHGQFDKDVNYNRIYRSEQKPERIGKKYQWIALFELLARISDNFEFKEERRSNKIEKYEGSWQLNIRDIDPSCTLKDFPNENPYNIPVFSNSEIQEQYSAWNKKVSHSEWLKKVSDLPNPKNMIEFIDRHGNYWVVIEGFIEWLDETPPEQEKYDLPTRRLWYMIKSYLVNEEDKEKVFEWAKQQHFMGRWMPESNSFYNVYLGEYPWAPSSMYQHVPYYHHDGWTDGNGERNIPAKILVTDDGYQSSGSSIDCSTNETINVKLPAKFIVDEMNLIQNYVDGRFFDRNGELIVFDPSVFDNNIPRYVLIKKDKLSDFLKTHNYSLLWTLLGEKDMIGGMVIGQPLGWLEINGAYTLDSNNKIIGTKKSLFKKL